MDGTGTLPAILNVVGILPTMSGMGNLPVIQSAAGTLAAFESRKVAAFSQELFDMMLARVVGTVVATRKEPSLEGLRFMVCRPVDMEGKESSSSVIAADVVGAGVGEMILYATGSSARQTVMTNNRPCDAVIMAIVDNWEVGGEVKYRKSEDA